MRILDNYEIKRLVHMRATRMSCPSKLIRESFYFLKT